MHYSIIIYALKVLICSEFHTVQKFIGSFHPLVIFYMWNNYNCFRQSNLLSSTLPSAFVILK